VMNQSLRPQCWLTSPNQNAARAAAVFPDEQSAF
jgi:hypothetical protein